MNTIVLYKHLENCMYSIQNRIYRMWIKLVFPFSKPDIFMLGRPLIDKNCVYSNL